MIESFTQSGKNIVQNHGRELAYFLLPETKKQKKERKGERLIKMAAK